jgi:hypothetical protein
MDILLILVLFFMAWLGGHALDYLFNKVEKAIKGEGNDDAVSTPGEQSIYGSPRPAATKAVGKQPARIYLVPSATARH